MVVQLTMYQKLSKEDQVPGSQAKAGVKAWAIQDPVGGSRLFQFGSWVAFNLCHGPQQHSNKSLLTHVVY